MANLHMPSTSASPAAAQYLGHGRLPVELHTIIVSLLCPYCSTHESHMPATQEARMLQRALGNVSASCRNLLAVVGEHRSHSFIMPFDASFSRSSPWVEDMYDQVDIAQRFHTSALPGLLERLIRHQGARHGLRYLSVRPSTLNYKAGVTEDRLRLFVHASTYMAIPVPGFVPGLFNLPRRNRLMARRLQVGHSAWLDGELWLWDGLMGPPNCTILDAWLVRLLLFGLSPRLQKLLLHPLMLTWVSAMPVGPMPWLRSVTTLALPQDSGRVSFRLAPPTSMVQMESLLPMFPRLAALQNDEQELAWSPFTRQLVPRPPPLYPLLRRLVLAAGQPLQLRHLCQTLNECPGLEELHLHRRFSGLRGAHDPAFSNASVLDGVQHTLLRLTYSSTLVTQTPGDGELHVGLDCYEEPRLADVPHFGAFARLQELTIDQALLGRMAAHLDRIAVRCGPHFPDLHWKLPPTLHTLRVRAVFNWERLALQFWTLASACAAGRLPLLRDVCVALVCTGRVVMDHPWRPQPLDLTPGDMTAMARERLAAVGVALWVATDPFVPPPGEPEEHDFGLVPAGYPVVFEVRHHFFPLP